MKYPNSRKEERKQKRLNKKLNKKLSASSGKVEKVLLSSQEKKHLKNNDVVKTIIKNTKKIKQTTKNSTQKSKSPVQNSPKTKTDVALPDKTDKSKESGLKFSSNVSSRMAALQAFIENETGTSAHTTTTEPKKKKKKKEIEEKKKTNDKKNSDLEKGIDKDNKEINDIQRQLRFNAKQKKSKQLLVNVFGNDITELIDVLDYEPGSDLPPLTDTVLSSTEDAPKKTTDVPKLKLPANAIKIDTAKLFFEDDDIPENIKASESLTTTVNGVKSNQGKKKHPKTEDALTSPAKNGKKKKKAKKNKNSPNSKNVGVPPLVVTPIIKKSNSRVNNGSRNISFSLKDTKVRLIPTVVKRNGFIVQEQGANNKFLDLNHSDIPKFLSNESILSLCDTSSDSEDEEITTNKKRKLGNQNGGPVKMPRLDSSSDENEEEQSDEESEDGDEASDFGYEDLIDGEDNDCDMDEMIDDEGLDEEEDSDIDEEGSDEEEGSDMDELVDEEEDFDEADFEGMEGFDLNDDDSDEDIHMVEEFSDSSDEEEEKVQPKETTKKSKDAKKKDIQREDIYGRLRDGDGNVVEETVDETSEKSSAEIQKQLATPQMKKVRTQLRGRLNRLAEVNLQGTVTMVTGLYSSHPRHLINVMLAEVLLAELGGAVTPTARHRQECAVLVVSVTASIGQEVCAHILTDFTMAWHKEVQATTNTVRANNLLLFVGELYNFSVVHSALIVDALKLLANSLNSNTVDQLINLMSSIGFVLRRDDPSSLKDLILSIQEKTAGEGAKDIPQIELLHTVLRAVKNNNESKMPNYDTTYVDHLRKILKGIMGESPVFSGSLRVTLEDLLLSETRGRWWVVGSAWTGSSLPSKANKEKNSNSSNQSQFTADFMKLAETMRITRPPKINILFALTVGSQDNSQAFSSILALNLPTTQEKAIFDVLLYCVQKMKAYKSFYTLVCKDLCKHDKKHSRSLQHSLWDKFSDFDALKKKELKNLSKFVVEIIKSDTLNLSLLKTLPFSDTSSKIVTFLEDILVQLFDAKEGCHVSEFAFKQLFKSSKLRTFRIQIKMFINMFIVPKFNEGKLTPTCELFKQRIDNVLDILATDQGALL